MNDVIPSGQVGRDQIERLLTGGPLSEGYKPTLPLWALNPADAIPQFYLMRDVELMMTHPVVRANLNYFKSGVAQAEFWGGPTPDNNPQGLPICPDSPAVEVFVREHCERFWDRGVPKLQGGYEYGWIAGEPTYKDDGEGLVWDDLIQFSPRDCFLLTQKNKPVGVRLNQIKNEYPISDDGLMNLVKNGGSGTVDLWMATEDVPAKALWYAHNPRYNNHYGQSQLIGAWRPWRRLAWKDGAESSADGGIYRFAYTGPLIKYPEESYTAPPGTPATAVGSDGRARRNGHDIARQLGEWYKAGASVGIPSTRYPNEMGGGPKWEAEFPQSTLNISGLIENIKYLCDQISFGCGVPPELLQAAESGSGYSGRAIPQEAFILAQQQIADAMLHLFVTQILAPLVKWRFGPVRWQVKVKPLLLTKRQQQQGGFQQGDNQTGQRQEAGPGGGNRQTGTTPPVPKDMLVTPGQTGQDQDDDGLFSLDAIKAARSQMIAKTILAMGEAA